MTAGATVKRPDLWRVVFSRVPVTDMLRFHLFTVGHSWIREFGASVNANEVRNVLAYSPLHNVKKAKYPAMIVATGDNDDRVVPFHTYKFVATL
jgi:prolyl oligopeptidase